MNAYLLEIGLEEMPADLVVPSARQLAEKIQTTCQQNQIPFQSLQIFSSPRRLAVLVKGLPDKQQDLISEIKGPPLQIARDKKGQWSKAALGFVKKNQADVRELYIKEFHGKDFLFIRKEIRGKPTSQVIERHVKGWITELTFPRTMRWGQYKMKFIRPVRWLISLWNDQILPVSLEMVAADNQLRGHRFLHPKPVLLPHAEQYPSMMEMLHVVASHEKRRSMIVEQVSVLEERHNFCVVLENDLLEEVTNLVEWPTVLLGSFANEFLQLPTEILVTAMAEHQRYFPVYDQHQRLLPGFITVRNGDKHHASIVVKGNEKVIRARLNDARFFFLEDQKRDPSFFNKKAESVVFFRKRGSIAQRIERLKILSIFVSEQLRLSEQQKSVVERIATLCKFDLQTQMVSEFPSLQGIIGAHYARSWKEDPLVSQGIREHYYPRFAQDCIPKHPEIVAVAIADKTDMLVTAFSLNLIPTGSADPYALRRMAQGIVQIVLESKLLISLRELSTRSLEILNKQQGLSLNIHNITEELTQFFALRQRFFMQEAKIRYDVIEASLAAKSLLPIQQLQLAEMASDHLESPAFKCAVEAIVRAENISKTQSHIPEWVSKDSFAEPEEKALWKKIEPLTNSTLDLNQYFQTLFELEPAITLFFDKVLVMDEDLINRQNRLFLCRSIANWSAHYMDLSKIVFSRES